MEKEKKSNTLVVVLIIIIIGLVGFIVYDEVINKEEKINKKATNQENIVENNNNIKSTDDSIKNDVEMLKKFKDTFKKVYNVKSNQNPRYCGKYEIFPVEGSAMYDYFSTEYNSYEEMINDLKQYATEEVIDLDSKNYYEKDGKLYCGKGTNTGILNTDDYVIELIDVESNEITANAMVEQSYFNNKDYKIVQKYMIKYIKSENNWIISEYLQKYDTSLNKQN